MITSRIRIFIIVTAALLCMSCKSRHAGVSDAKQTIELVRPDNMSEQEAQWFAWLQPRADSIICAYRKAYGNFIDPDEVRKAFAPIGYDGSNVTSYRKLEKALVRKLYREVLRDVVAAEQQPTILFLTGCGGAGKSTATKNHPNVMERINKSSIVYDSALNSYQSLNDVITVALKAGIKEQDMTVVPVYNDMVTSFSNSVTRGLRSGRFLSINYVVTDAFPSNQGKIAKLRKKHRKISIMPIDNIGNNGGKLATVEQAVKWDYRVKDEDVNKILDIYQNLQRMALSGELKPNQLQCVNEGLEKVGLYPGLSDATRLRIAQLAK